jgi:hypothetical protein
MMVVVETIIVSNIAMPMKKRVPIIKAAPVLMVGQKRLTDVNAAFTGLAMKTVLIAL